MAAGPKKTNVGKTFRPTFWYANGVRGRRIELDNFLGQQGVDVCLFSETYFGPGQDFRFANYICYRTHRSTIGGETAILVRRAMDHHPVPVSVSGIWRQAQ